MQDIRDVPVSSSSQQTDDGRNAFNDMHAMMCFARTGRRDEAASFLAALEREAAGFHDTARMARETSLPVAHAIAAFADGDYSVTVSKLLPIRFDMRFFGGSHAQRDVLAQTLILAAVRDGQRHLARALG